MKLRLGLTFFGVFSLLSVLTGCDGGLSCPFDRPSCCSNVLFGCGRFELPQGCSCSDYFAGVGSSAFSVERGKLTRMSVASAAGKWRVSLTRRDSSCRSLRSNVAATVTVRQSRGRVIMKLPAVATLRGARSGNRIKATGQYMPLAFLGCSARISSEMNLTSATTASMVGGVTVTCSRRTFNNCQASYEGRAVRIVPGR